MTRDSNPGLVSLKPYGYSTEVGVLPDTWGAGGRKWRSWPQFYPLGWVTFQPHILNGQGSAKEACRQLTQGLWSSLPQGTMQCSSQGPLCVPLALVLGLGSGEPLALGRLPGTPGVSSEHHRVLAVYGLELVEVILRPGGFPPTPWAGEALRVPPSFPS